MTGEGETCSGDSESGPGFSRDSFRPNSALYFDGSKGIKAWHKSLRGGDFGDAENLTSARSSGASSTFNKTRECVQHNTRGRVNPAYGRCTTCTYMTRVSCIEVLPLIQARARLQHPTIEPAQA